jgi:5'(3')-deoxyribonucleotidase
MFCEDDFFEYLSMYDGASEILPRLCETYDVVICTCATPLNASKKVLWIEEHLPYISEVITVIKNGNNGVGKGRIHMIEKNSIFIDDHPSNLISTKAEHKYLFKYKETEFNSNWDGEILSSWNNIAEKLL